MVKTLIGEVKHFFGKISVAVIELSASIKVGDELKFKYGGYKFEQVVGVMQIDYSKIKVAKGQAIGMKTVRPVHECAEVFKVEE